MCVFVCVWLITKINGNTHTSIIDASNKCSTASYPVKKCTIPSENAIK